MLLAINDDVEITPVDTSDENTGGLMNEDEVV